MCHELGLIPASSQEADTELEKAVECGLCCGSTYIHGMAGMAFLTHRMKTGEPLADLFDWAKKFGRTFLHGSQCTFKPWAEIVHLLEWLTSHEPGASIALQNYRPALLSLRPSFGKLNWILALILDLPLSRTPTLTDPPLTIGFYGAYAAARECSRNSVQSAAVLERLDRIIMEVEVACKLKASRDVYKLYLLMAERVR